MTRPSIAILGGSGLVGSGVVEAFSRSADLIAPTHAQLDVLEPTPLETFITTTRAQSVVNCVAAADVDGSELEAGDRTGRVYRVNVDFPRLLAELCQQTSKHLVHL